MGKRILILFWIFFSLLGFLFVQPAQAQGNKPLVLVLNGDGVIAPAMAEYVARGIHAAEQQGAEAVILQLNTPGGSIDAMTRMITDIRASTVPVIVYVSPRGAMAGSAGTIITLAGHAAAMAPETAIGAASPVGPQGQDLSQTEQAKTKNIMDATIRSLAARRNPKAVTLAQQMIDSAKAVSANEALQIGLVDFIANDTHDLLRQVNGFTVQMGNGYRTLNTANAETVPFQPSLIEQVLAALTDPNIVFLLLMMGIQAILIEVSHPGGWVAGFVGVVCLALATYGLGILPVNLFGLIFLATAFVLFILDLKAPTHGALTAAGVGSLVVGGLVLFNSPGAPNFERVSVPLVFASSIFIGGIFSVLLLFALRARSLPIQTGQQSLIGRTGVAETSLAPEGEGIVQLGGEQWTAELAEDGEALPVGTPVEVVQVKGIHLLVRKAP
jgi:membrane-bound serine protease (ClpP class)